MSKLYIKNKFGQTPLELLNKSDVSLKAKGLFAYLQAKPEGWNFSMEAMSNQLLEGIKSIRSGLKELENAGYLIRDNKQNNSGIWETDYYLYIEPVEPKPLSKRNQPYSHHGHADDGHTHDADTAKGLYIDKKNLDKKNRKKEIDIKKINKKENLELLKKINLIALNEFRAEILSSSITKEKFEKNKRWANFSEFSVEQAKIDINRVLDKVEDWIDRLTDHKKLSAKPKIASRFKQFAIGENIGWRQPSQFNIKKNNYNAVSNASLYQDDNTPQLFVFQLSEENLDLSVLKNKIKKYEELNFEVSFSRDLLIQLKEKYGNVTVINQLPITEYQLVEVTS